MDITTIKYLDAPIDKFSESAIKNINELMRLTITHKPDLILVLGRTHNVQKLYKVFANQIYHNRCELNISMNILPYAQWYFEDFPDKLDQRIKSYKTQKYTFEYDCIPMINTCNPEFIQTIYESKYSYVLVRVKEKDNSDELLVSSPLLSGTKEMNNLIFIEADLRPLKIHK